MFISDINLKRIRRLTAKTAVIYFTVTFVCVLISNIYTLFGRGVRSDSMDYMFLYPLLGGVGVFLPIALLIPILPDNLRYISRAGYNLYNSGIASLASAAMLAGIAEIAGTSTVWVIYLKAAGITMFVVAIICQITVCSKRY